jgi:hypothetical protein
MFCGLVTLEMEFEDSEEEEDFEALKDEENQQPVEVEDLLTKEKEDSQGMEVTKAMSGGPLENRISELMEIEEELQADENQDPETVMIETDCKSANAALEKRTSEIEVQTESCGITVGTQTESVGNEIEIPHITKQNDLETLTSPSPPSPGPPRQYDIDDLSSNLLQQYGNERNIEKEINKRKASLEGTAEKAARVRQAQWVRDRISLQQAIDNLFSDHLILHEKAHALRLHFEREKGLWSKAFENKIQNLKSHPMISSNSLDPFFRKQQDEEDADNARVDSLKSPTNSDSDEFQYFKPLVKKKRSLDDEMDLPPLLDLNDEEKSQISNNIVLRTNEISPQNSPEQNSQLSFKQNRKFRFPTKLSK